MVDYKIVAEKEYTTLQFDKPEIALCMIVKNEHLRLQYTLDSVKDFISAIVIFDTGSTDDTLDIIQNFSQKHKINLYLIQGTFVNFYVSRNVVLKYAEKVDIHYLLLMDCNDELRGSSELKKMCEFGIKDPAVDGFLLRQHWKNPATNDKYFNVRLIKNRKNWRYKGSVHEYIQIDGIESPKLIKVDQEEVELFQDRTQDDDKTIKRFTRDYELLINDYNEDPKNTRTLMYLAQTCGCLQKHDEAIFYSKERLKYNGFLEERYHSYMRCGDMSAVIQHDWYDIMKWYVKAYEEFNRAEPLVKIAEYYYILASKKLDAKETQNNLWRTAFMYIDSACRIPYPKESLLFVDASVYDYKRWHLMGIIGHYAGEHARGKEGAQMAMKAKNLDVDKNNYNLYVKFEKIQTNPEVKTEQPLTRQQFIDQEVARLMTNRKNLSLGNAKKIAELAWKSKKSS